jgi:hypothetical protein
MPLGSLLLRAPALVLLFFIPAAVWALASPLFSVPDEDAHVVKAVAVWSGQLGGADVRRDDGYVFTTYTLPAVWAQASTSPECFKFRRDVTADCAPPLTAPDGGAEQLGVATTAGHYPPLFYALVGWGGRVAPGATGVYLMRLTAAAIAAGFLALAVRALATVVRPQWALLGVLAAATPMVWFLAGSVNPNGLEIVAAIGVWATGLALVRWPERHEAPAPRFLAVGLLVAGVVMTFTRSLSPVFLAGTLALVLLTARPSSLRRLAQQRLPRIVAAVLVGATVVSAALILFSGHLDAVPGKAITPGAGALRNVVGETPVYVQQMVAVFGWLDTRVAQLTLYAWLFVVFVLIGLALALLPVRRNVALLLTIAATVVLPIAAQVPRAATQGLPWQGRYTLPLAVGVPLLAVLSIDLAAAKVPGLTRRVAVASGLVLGVGTLYAAWWALRRYVNGSDGSVWVFSGAWQPPLGAGVLLAVLAVFAGLCVTALAVVPDTAGDAAPASPRDPGADPTDTTDPTEPIEPASDPPRDAPAHRAPGPAAARAPAPLEATP